MATPGASSYRVEEGCFLRADRRRSPAGDSSAMKKESIFQAVNFSVNVLLITSVLLSLFGLAWEYSTRWYLSGFSNAVLPYASSPEKKVAAILSWMEHGPARETQYYSDDAEN